ncbi:MAG: M18 family aminopeptidase [Butyrivibrio sp.]|nr:M18 family aminopeptidase [Butyrivibrio sp.]
MTTKTKTKKTAQRRLAEQVLTHITASPTAYHVVANMIRRLEDAGFTGLPEEERWQLAPGGRYYVTRNGSSIIAFTIPGRDFRGYQIIASHSDSPSFRIKENPEMEAAGYLRLNVERYGGMLCAPWFDRPLSIAGRVVVRGRDGALETRLIQPDRDLLMLPSLAIHMNREANDGMKYNAQTDMLPLFGEAADKGRFRALLASEAGVPEQDILSDDLYLVVRQAPSFWGAEEQYFSSPRLDDQECAWCSLEGFLAADNEEQVMLHCVLDNEEVGSRTRQGAASTFLQSVLVRIGESLGRDGQDYHTALASSFMVSADNAHAVHPAHPDKADPVHRPRMNGGIVLKYAANQNYTTDGVSAAVVRDLCLREKIPLQTFFNRSDQPGGSTLGNISNTQVSLMAADIGLAQLAMHSPYETAGVSDVGALVDFCRAFYRAGAPRIRETCHS